MSILDSIKAAEEKAEQMKADANEKVKTLQINMKKSTDEKIKQMYDEHWKNVQNSNNDANKRCEELEQNFIDITEQQNQKLTDLANKNVNIVIDYIIKKVLNL